MPAELDPGTLRGPTETGWRGAPLVLSAVMLLAALVRLPGLDQAPPGLHQDEAVNAWNACCLIHKGCDQFGVRWPVFCMRAIGDFRSTLYTYSQIPFQAIGGMNAWTIRLPAALGGILTVGLLYVIGRRLFGWRVGLIAALLLAINPTHIQLSRLGLEAAQTPLLILLAFVSLLWAGFPLGDGEVRIRPGRAVVAGLVTGMCCYGYPAVRLFLPLFLTACVLCTWTAWWGLLKSRRGVLALLGLAVAVGVTFGPLAYKHIAEPEVIGKRGRTTWIWKADDSAATRAELVLRRYAMHFDPRVMFISGDQDETFWTVPLGFVPRYLAPLLLLGLLATVPRIRASRAARVVLVGVVLYPIADATNWHVSMHGLRCSSGLAWLVLLGAVGLSRTSDFLGARQLRASRLALGMALVGLIVMDSVEFTRRYCWERTLRLPTYYGTHMDLLEACAWLEPRLGEVDRVISFATGPNPGYTPYLMTLVRLRHSPEQWFAEPRVVDTSGLWDRTSQYGKFHFLNADERAELVSQLRSDGKDERVVFFLRANDPAPCTPAACVHAPDGSSAIVIYDCRL